MLNPLLEYYKVDLDRKGCFIVFEGIDGSGKSIQVRELSRKLKNMKYYSETTHEPYYEGNIGNFIRKILKEKIVLSDEALALLFAADRMEHTQNVIRPILDENSIIICDRYIYSSMAYQCSEPNSKIDVNWVKLINNFALKPDIVFFLDIHPEIGIKRLNNGQKRVQDDKYFETIDKQTRIREKYLEIFKFEKNDDSKIVKNIVEDVLIIKIDANIRIKTIREIIGRFVKPILIEKNIPKDDNKRLRDSLFLMIILRGKLLRNEIFS